MHAEAAWIGTGRGLDVGRHPEPGDTAPCILRYFRTDLRHSRMKRSLFYFHRVLPFRNRHSLTKSLMEEGRPAVAAEAGSRGSQHAEAAEAASEPAEAASRGSKGTFYI